MLPPLLFADLPALLRGHLLQAPADPAAAVRHLLLDSRRAGPPAGALFFALRGPSHDGHRYLPQAYAQGVRLFVVADGATLPGSLAAYPGAGIVAVPSPLGALQALAAAHRQQFGGPVWAITGSNGKTIVKEWLAQLLGPDEVICRSPRSYNSQVGVPLSVWELSPERHTLGLFEAGISEVGEMAKLAAIIQPTEGIFTTLGTAHDAGFASEAEKLREKLRLFEGPGFRRLYYCADQGPVREAVAALGLPGFGWTRHDAPGAALRFRVAPTGADGTAVKARAGELGPRADFVLPFADEPSVENALHCLAVLLARGVAPAEIQRRLARLQPVAMRLEMKQGRHDSYLLDDTYNNDLAGLALALAALGRQARPGRRTLILSDVLESGLTGPALYARVGALAQAHGVTRLVGIGPEISAEMNELKVKREKLKPNETEELPTLLTFNSQLLTEFYPTTEAFLAQFNPADFAHETILVKGARRFGFERIVAALQAQQHGTVLEVNLDALAHNLQHFRQQLRPGTKLMVMVKAFAYGAGSYEVASLLEFQRADYLAVAYADEGIALREAGIGLPIMVMNPAPDAFELLRRHRLEPEIYSFEILEAYLATFPAADAPTHSFTNSPIHIKLDTGMRRLGFEEADVPALGALLRQHRARLPVAGIMTHMAAADDPAHDDFTRQQLAAFGRMAGALEEALGHPVLKHALNSAGIRRFPEAHFDMVRLGIGLYGVDASGMDASALRPVSTLRTTISQIKTLPAGATVGYGRRGTATGADRRIATLAIGYADGYDRRFSNGAGVVLVHGQRAPVVGSVAMDMCMVDVTDIPAARAGDVAVVFGAELPLPLLAARIGTIAYELLTNVSERVKRVFVSE
ncbi:bifunctional UDP-N-acetylmuramoyl-tripeptide:D-alanyl-D-alanine ligase/alanine racemase [Hymenobacter nivis]|uniref:bifunctional UDP-N-acetylmuramoyl-tripeptide:D-alanyl-D-alanine ligase/alanine racemase n=1 Tax=Hymenobacter nivis TaxID=1850093 RepID=UPI001F022C73|nr:bifunctional UDP-N-acetylmuramoyl-tripeptide:D-alanyl-D-alanine ligase/alanine racemase [Hymenobacter nivis]